MPNALCHECAAVVTWTQEGPPPGILPGAPAKILSLVHVEDQRLPDRTRHVSEWRGFAFEEPGQPRVVFCGPCIGKAARASKPARTATP